MERIVMVNQRNNGDDGREAAVPAALVEDLRGLYGGGLSVEPAVDEAIAGLARGRFASLRRRRLVLRWVGGGLAAAAAIGLVFRVVMPGAGPSADRAVHAAAVREDIDRNGRVDILDAFALARAIESGAGFSASRDINGDGVVDRRDVDAVAVTAVAVSGGSV